ncbi:hypothetical protein [Dyadobacter crusticola]|uniref:hypothetical protein n=1 Tax=Dyadobacter crusticola TaxID=292407 RepID=UPI0012F82602|nr:hypothetical protein [Dyadobacter crusticola]
MKKFLNFLFVAAAAILAVHIVPEIQDLYGAAGSVGGYSLAVIASFVGFKNIEEQTANPAGIRRFGIVPVADLDDSTIDWPRGSGLSPHINVATMEVTMAVPLKAGKTVAIITPADNSANLNFEIQGDRFYQAYKHGVAFDIAGQSKAQSVEFRKLLNTGVILFAEYFDGDIRVVGSKLSPIILKSKGDSGKKGGDKRGYAVSGDNDSYVTEPPFYPATLALPGMVEVEAEGGA